jgi:hypothetical protein
MADNTKKNPVRFRADFITILLSRSCLLAGYRVLEGKGTPFKEEFP